MSRTNPKAKAKAMPASSVTMLNAMSTVRRCRKVKRSWLPSAVPIPVSAAASSGPLLTLATLPSLLTLSLLAAILFFGGIAEGLKCHMCGQYNEGVGSITPCSNYSKEIAHLYLKECTKKSEKFCVKYVSELSTVRDCATECVEKEIWETQTYCCKEDGCNSGDNLKYSVVLLALPFFKIIWVVLRDFLKVRR